MGELKSILSSRAVCIMIMQFGGITIWDYWVVSHTYSSVLTLSWAFPRGPTAAACLVFVIFGDKLFHRTPAWVTVVISAMAALSILAISKQDPANGYGMMAAIVISWVCLAWVAVLCALNISKLPSSHVLVVVVFGAILSLLLITLASALPEGLSSVLVCLSPFTASAYILINHYPVETAKVLSFEKDGLSPIAESIFPLACMMFVYSLANVFLKSQYGSWAFGPSPNLAIPLIAQAVALLCLAFIIWWVFIKKRTLHLYMLLRMPLALLTCSLVMLVITNDSPFLQVMTYAASLLLLPFIWLITIDATKHSRISPVRSIAFGLMTYYGSYLIGRIVFRILMSEAPELSTLNWKSSLILLAILSLSVIFAPDPDGHIMRVLLGDINNKIPHVSDYETIEERCLVLAKQAGLSERESEIMVQLAKGKSKPFIAESLYISDNTVRTYSKRVYEKLDIHSRRELQELIGL